MPPYSVLTFHTHSFITFTKLSVLGSNNNSYSKLRTTNRGTILKTRAKGHSYYILWIDSTNDTYPYLECQLDT